VGLRDAGTARGPSGGPDRDSLDLGADAERPLVLLSAAGSATPASGGACAVREGAWIESDKVLPASMGGVREGGGAGSSDDRPEGCDGVSSGGLVIEGGVRSEGREGLGACESFGGDGEPGCNGGSDSLREVSSSLSFPADDDGASAT
jgi:hypothetical protein